MPIFLVYWSHMFLASRKDFAAGLSLSNTIKKEVMKDVLSENDQFLINYLKLFTVIFWILIVVWNKLD